MHQLQHQTSICAELKESVSILNKKINEMEINSKNASAEWCIMFVAQSLEARTFLRAINFSLSIFPPAINLNYSPQTYWKTTPAFTSSRYDNSLQLPSIQYLSEFRSFGKRDNYGWIIQIWLLSLQINSQNYYKFT